MTASDKPVPEGNPPDETLLRVLETLRGIVATANQVDDVKPVRAKLADWLKSITDELERRPPPSYPSLDPVTGLPARARAEEAIGKALDSGANACLCVLAIDRLATLNLKFGNKVGDEILRHYAETLRKQLPAEFQLFRWSGPALVALQLHANRIEQVRRDFGRLVDAQYEHVVNTPYRLIRLLVLPRWGVWQVIEPGAALLQKIDNFASMPALGGPSTGG